MGYFKVKLNKQDKETNQKKYDLVDININEERLEDSKKVTIKKQYSKIDKEPYSKEWLIDAPSLPENVIIKKGTATLNNHLEYFNPTNLSEDDNHFDNRFIGIDNERTEKIAVLVHCYFIDVLIHTVLPKLLPLSKYADFYFNFIKNNDTVNQTMAIEIIKSNFDNFTINYTEKNIGRDINGQFNNLKSIYKTNKKYDFYLLVHTKKSTHLNKKAAKYWTDELLNSTVGNYDVINNILDNFTNNKKIGMVGCPKNKYETLKVMFHDNKEKYDTICDILGIDKKTKSYFIGGTFFWVKSEIIDHYFKNNDNLNTISSNFGEKGLLDGDWHHAMERIYGTLCYDLGYAINE
jgi:lipopolysaccharide biosynthesis protein